MDPANAAEALRETLLDIEEGADMVMVKPALAYLDLIRTIKDATQMPLAAYNVSGEYAMLKAAIAAGYLDERAAVLETLTSIRRAGADIIITYHAKDAARWLSEWAHRTARSDELYARRAVADARRRQLSRARDAIDRPRSRVHRLRRRARA